MFPQRAINDSNKSYVWKNAEFLKSLWMQGMSYRRLAQSIKENTGKGIDYSELAKFLSFYITTEDKVNRYARQVQGESLTESR